MYGAQTVKVVGRGEGWKVRDKKRGERRSERDGKRKREKKKKKEEENVVCSLFGLV